MSVMVLTSYPPRPAGFEGPHWDTLAEITTATQKKYCDLHGYDYKVDCSNVSAPVRSPRVDEPKSGYAPIRYMIKFLLMEHYLREESCLKKYDWVVWLDADVLITRFDLPLTKWQHGLTGDTTMVSGDFVTAWDVNSLHPTIMMMRNSRRMRGFVWACLNAGSNLFMQEEWSDNLALRFFLGWAPYKGLELSYSAQELCAMTPGVYPIPTDVREEFEWTKESFSLHLSALSLPKRVEIATKFVEDLKLL